MTRVQSPEIGTALRAALSLDAAGGMPLAFEQTILPVAVVADIRELLTTSYIPVNQGGEQLGVAGESSYTGLSWDAASLPKAQRILIDAIVVTAAANSTMFIGFKPGGMPGAQLGLPRRKVASLASSNVTAKVVSDSDVAVPTVFIDNVCGAFVLTASMPLRIEFKEPITLDAESQAFVVGLGTVNTSLRTYWEWREERP